MQKIRDYFTLEQDNYSIRSVLLLILIAWIFGVAVRMIWVFQHQDIEQYRWNDQFMINTNDGYYWAEGARDLITKPEFVDELSPVNRALPIITAAFAKLLPFISFETLIFYLPALLSSLIVVPIILIGHSLSLTRVGFVASLLAVIAHSYYNRTMVGYYDDDALVIVLPLLVLFSLILGVRKQDNRYLVALLLTTLISHWYYPGSYSLHIAMTLMLLIYTLAFHRKEMFNYKLIGFSLLALAYIGFWLKFAVAFAFLAIFLYFKERADKFTLPFLAISVVFVLMSGGFAPIISQLESYVFRSTVAASSSDLHFYNVVQTVREAGAISFDTFSSRISGHPITFVLALFGTAFFMIAHRVMLLALPFIGLGFLAYGLPPFIAPAGLRFTIYAVPILALGFSYLAFFTGSRLTKNRAVSLGITAAVTVAALVPNILHINGYRVPTVFHSSEVQRLEDLGKIANPRVDYAISWWDYGYPIRYYSFTKTLVDGGKHAGADNFAPSFILTTPNQEAASRLARSVVEINDKMVADRNYSSVIAAVMQEQNISDPTQFLISLGDDSYKLPEKTREIYLVLPFRMGDIFQTVALFSHTDLATGRQFPAPFFARVVATNNSPTAVTFSNGYILNLQTGTIAINRQNIQLRDFITIQADNSGREYINAQRVNPNGQLNLIYFASMGVFWIVDDRAFSSNYVQLFALGNYDPRYLEPVIVKPDMKIYRLKI